MARNRSTRAAALTLCPVVALVFFVSAFVVALGQTGAAGQSGSVTLDVGSLPAGAVKTVTLTIHALGDARWPVFVTTDANGHDIALVGQPQSASGCGLTWTHAAGYAPIVVASWDAFEDPCSAAMFTPVGDCMNGPCSHALDRLPTARHGDLLTIDVDRLVPGRPGRVRSL